MVTNYKKLVLYFLFFIYFVRLHYNVHMDMFSYRNILIEIVLDVILCIYCDNSNMFQFLFRIASGPNLRILEFPRGYRLIYFIKKPNQNKTSSVVRCVRYSFANLHYDRLLSRESRSEKVGEIERQTYGERTFIITRAICFNTMYSQITQFLSAIPLNHNWKYKPILILTKIQLFWKILLW